MTNSHDQMFNDEEKIKGQDSLLSITKQGAIKCELCQYVSVSLLEVCKHLEIEHQLSKEAINFLCLKMNFNPMNISKQTKISKLTPSTPHHANFQCKRCDKLFASYLGLMQHNGKIHLTKYKDKKCEICGNKFKHKHALKFHKLQVHEKGTRVQCIRCTKVLYNKYHLEKHLAGCRMTTYDSMNHQHNN